MSASREREREYENNVARYHESYFVLAFIFCGIVTLATLGYLLLIIFEAIDSSPPQKSTTQIQFTDEEKKIIKERKNPTKIESLDGMSPCTPNQIEELLNIKGLDHLGPSDSKKYSMRPDEMPCRMDENRKYKIHKKSGLTITAELATIANLGLGAALLYIEITKEDTPGKNEKPGNEIKPNGKDNEISQTSLPNDNDIRSCKGVSTYYRKKINSLSEKPEIERISDSKFSITWIKNKLICTCIKQENPEWGISCKPL